MRLEIFALRMPKSCWPPSLMVSRSETHPEEDRLFIEELKKNLHSPIEIEEVDCNLEDFQTAKALVDSLVHFMEHSKKSPKISR